MYRFVRSSIIRALYLYYDEIIVIGTENIPVNGGFIFAPNHRNALMDALAAVLITPKHKSTTFLARADIFKNKNVAKFMRFSKIMPAFRIRDGFENLGKNNEVFDQCVELLEANQALCIMPEGNQELPHKVRQLVKGIFRVAFSVQQRNKTEHPLQIVPVGFDYGDIVKYGKHLIINIGKPIDVSDYSQSHIENPPKAVNEIKDELKHRLEQLTLHIDSEKNYESILSAIEYSHLKMLRKSEQKPTTLSAYNMRKQLADKLCAVDKEQPERLEELATLTSEYKNSLEKHRIQYRNVDCKKSAKTLLLNSLLLIISFPFAMVGFLMNALPFFMPVWIRKILKVKFEGFFSSIQFVLGLILFPVFYLTQSLLLCYVFSISALYIPFILVMHLITGILCFKYYSILKCTFASIRYKLLPEKERKKIKILRNQIIEIVAQKKRNS
jgi:1-acyl-sn-glycerol-3-phosphate acyltransferase